MPKDLEDEEFVARLIEAGWSEADARAELLRLDEDIDEAGYDGP